MNRERDLTHEKQYHPPFIEIIPNYLWLINGKPFTEATGLLIKTDKGMILIDPGSGSMLKI